MKEEEPMVPSAAGLELSAFCLSSSELEDAVLEEDWHFLFTVMGMLQLSRYLDESTHTEMLIHKRPIFSEHTHRTDNNRNVKMN